MWILQPLIPVSGQRWSICAARVRRSARGRPCLTLRPCRAIAERSRDESARALFEQLAAECCPVARVSLARFPSGGGFGWVLRHAGAPPPADPTPGLSVLTTPPHGTSSAGRIAADAAPTSPSQARLGGAHKPAADETGAGERTGTRPSAGDDGAAAAGPIGGGPLTLLSVPLRLCLSREIPGCCPPALRSQALRALFSGAGRTADGGSGSEELPWEIPLAAALLWACRRGELAAAAAQDAKETAAGPPGAAAAAAAVGRTGVVRAAGCDSVGSGGCSSTGDDEDESVFARFWLRYRRLLPDIGSLSTLLFFGEEELGELQDPPLAAEARAWQQTVRNAYDKWIVAAPFRAEVGEVTLAEWMWAVGCVESRAFGFRSAADGRQLHAYVPFFCLANYQPGAPTLHVLRLDPDPDLSPDKDRNPHPGLDSDPDLDPVLSPGPGPREVVECVARGSTKAGGAASSSRSSSGASGPGGSCPGGRALAGSGAGQEARPGSQRLGRATAAAAGSSSSSSWEPTANMVLIRTEGQDHGRRHRHGNHPAGQVGSAQERGGRQRREEEEDEQEQEEQRTAAREQPEGDERDPGVQVYIDYGKKDNRSLLNQYGFILYGNPYDRLEWAGAQLDLAHRMRRDWVYDMAEQLSREAAEAAAGSGAPSPPSSAADAVRRRFRSAATSIVEACGWRSLRERRLVTPDSETLALGVLTQWVEGQLRSFHTTAEHDSELLLLLLLMDHREERGAAAVARGRCDIGTTEGVGTETASEVSLAGVGCSAVELVSGVALREPVVRAAAGVTDGGGEAVAAERAVVSALGVTSRLRWAIEYRLERKLLLLAALTLLHRLKDGCGAQQAVGGAAQSSA